MSDSVVVHHDRAHKCFYMHLGGRRIGAVGYAVALSEKDALNHFLRVRPSALAALRKHLAK